MEYITQEQFIKLVKEYFPEPQMPIVAFRVKGLAQYSTRQFNHPWSHSWSQKVDRDKLTPFQEEM